MRKSLIVEKKLGIPADYQYKALRSDNFFQANWHSNKLVVQDYVLKLTGAKKVLDLGTGSGNFELRFAKKLSKITGIDYNDEAINFLNREFEKRGIKNVRLVNQDIRRIDKVKGLGTFDLIIMTDIIEHIPIKDANIVVKKLKKHLRTGGYLCVITPNYKSPWLFIEKILDRFTVFPHFENKQHLAKYYESNLRKMMSSNGYQPLLFRTFNYISFIFLTKTMSNVLVKLELSLPFSFGNLILYLFKI